jgi:hypothetical protein
VESGLHTGMSYIPTLKMDSVLRWTHCTRLSFLSRALRHRVAFLKRQGFWCKSLRLSTRVAPSWVPCWLWPEPRTAACAPSLSISVYRAWSTAPIPITIHFTERYETVRWNTCNRSVYDMIFVTNGFRLYYAAFCIFKWESIQAVQNITPLGGIRSVSPEHRFLGRHSISQSRTSRPWAALDQPVQNITSLGGIRSVSPERRVLGRHAIGRSKTSYPWAALDQPVQNITSLCGTRSVSPEHHVLVRHSTSQSRTSRPWAALDQSVQNMTSLGVIINFITFRVASPFRKLLVPRLLII